MKKCRARENRERNECSESMWICLKWWAELLTFHLLHHKLDLTFVCIKNNGAVLTKYKTSQIKLPSSYFYSYWLVLFQLLHSKCFIILITEKLFHLHRYKSYCNKPNRQPLRSLYFILEHEIETELLFAEKVTQFSFMWCGLILCLSGELRGMGGSNISMLDCLWTRDESVLKRGQKSLLVEGCQVTIQSLSYWYLLCVSSKYCTTDRNSGI